MLITIFIFDDSRGIFSISKITFEKNPSNLCNIGIAEIVLQICFAPTCTLTNKIYYANIQFCKPIVFLGIFMYGTMYGWQGLTCQKAMADGKQ